MKLNANLKKKLINSLTSTKDWHKTALKSATGTKDKDALKALVDAHKDTIKVRKAKHVYKDTLVDDLTRNLSMKTTLAFSNANANSDVYNRTYLNAATSLLADVAINL